MGMAVAALTHREVTRIVLTRPAVEAGEKLGFLPGDMYAKVNPYLRPMYDALYDMMDIDQANRLVERGEIEIAPLAYMRGRTLNDAFIILDEGQNVTPEQMKMFLTRLGFRSKAIITGDITQVDLPAGNPSGLIEIQSIIHDIPASDSSISTIATSSATGWFRRSSRPTNDTRKQARAQNASVCRRNDLAMIRVAVSNRQHTITLDAPRLKRRARRVLRDMGLAETELSVVFVDDEEMQRLNAAYRSLDRPTDVLAFAMAEGAFGDLNSRAPGRRGDFDPDRSASGGTRRPVW
jgi:hypothetical protein